MSLSFTHRLTGTYKALKCKLIQWKPYHYYVVPMSLASDVSAPRGELGASLVEDIRNCRSYESPSVKCLKRPSFA